MIEDGVSEMGTGLWMGWLLMFSGAILAIASGLTSRKSTGLHRAGWLVGLAGILLTGGSAIGLMLEGPWAVNMSWALPVGGIVLRVNAPEALMILLIQVVGGLIVLARPWGDKPLDTAAFLILLPALGLCLTARDVVLFLMAWEIMALTGVVWQRGRGLPEDHYDGHGLWAYLVSAHLATVCLLIVLPILALSEGQAFSMGQPILWDTVASKPMASRTIWIYVVLIIAGFGTKAGLVPFQPWVRTVYRNAPPWFGAASSGLMAKVSLFLMFRTLVQMVPKIGPDRLPWLAGGLILMGLTSGLMGLAGALTSARIKVVLGYSSVENVGIIVLGVGVGLWGVTREAWPVAVFCFCGSWLHMINHMLSKSLLFLATSAVTQTTGTDDLARLGGLLKRMPVAGRAFGIGAMSLAAMVPLNAFNSELLMYNGLFLGVLTLGAAGRDLAILSVAVMGMIGGLAAVCFSGVWGLGFLGNARSESSASADESALEPRMKWALNLMSFMVLFLGVIPLAGLWLVWAPVMSLLNQLGCPNGAQQTTYDSIASILGNMSLISFILIALVVLIKRWRDNRQSHSTVDNQLTWDCGFGYTDTFPKGQYSGISYFEPLMPLVSKLTRLRIHHPDVSAPFPPQTTVRVESADGILIRIYEPIYRKIGQQLGRLRWIQAGSIQLYLAMLALTLMAMLIWQMIF